MEMRAAMAAYAAWIGYGHEARAEAWLKRLELNAAELEAFRTLPTPEGDAYVATPATLLAPGGRDAGGQPPRPTPRRPWSAPARPPPSRPSRGSPAPCRQRARACWPGLRSW
jgi:hypothetical protein